MIRVLVGDIFQSEAQTLVNTVNCIGVMGKGLALQFKKRFPEMYEDYVRRCERGEVKLGEPYLFKPLLPPWILNFPTKDHWRSVSKLADIEAGLAYLAEHVEEWGITSIAVPPLGCGAGQLDWRVVGPVLYRKLSQLPVPVELYAPFGTPDEQLSERFLEQKPQEIAPETIQSIYSPVEIDPSWFVIVEILKQIETEPYHWPVGRTRFQKIVYFATEEGLPTGLTFEKGSYGPFSRQLKRQITQLVNHRLIVEERQGRMFVVRVGPAYADIRPLFAGYLVQWRTLIDRVVDLFVRMDTKQTEIAATVHYAAVHLVQGDTLDERDVLQAVQNWKLRRTPAFDEEEIATTIRNLNTMSWLEADFRSDLPVPEELYF